MGLSAALAKVQQQVIKQGEKLEIDEDVKNVVRSARERIDEYIEALEEEYDEDNQSLIRQLKLAGEQLEEFGRII